MNQSPFSKPGFRTALLLGLTLLLGTWILYWPTLSFEFVSYDDPLYVPENAIVLQGWTWAGLKWAFTNIYVGHWHPLTWLSHMTVCQFFGSHPAGHHAVNVILHGFNGLLFFSVLRRMTGSTWRSAFAAALFAWHPLRVESVAWVAEHKDVLAGAFWLLTIWAYLRYVERPVQGRFALVVGFFAAGLLCKAILITLPMVLLLLDVWPLRRLQFPKSWRIPPYDAASTEVAPRETSALSWRDLVLEKVPLFALVAISVAITFYAGRIAGSMQEMSLAARVGNALVAYVRYAGKFLWPVDLAVLYPHPGSWPAWQVLGAAAILLLASVVFVAQVRRRPYLAVGWFWFLGVLVPVIGLVQVGVQSMADRYSYVPMLGLAVLVAWAAGEFARPLPFARAAGPVAAAFVAMVLAMVTRGQMEHWRNSVTLFSQAVAVTRDNAVAEYNLGQALSVRGQPEAAIPHYEAALRINPDYADARNNLGLVYFVKGDFLTATNHLYAALILNPDNANAHYHAGRALAALGDAAGSIPHYEAVLRLEPGHPWLHYWLGAAREAQGRLEDAVQCYTETLRRMPESEEALHKLGAVLLRLRKPQDALPHLEKANRLKPEHVANRTQLGIAYLMLGRPEEAISEFRKALVMEPDTPDALNHLAWLLATHPRSDLRNGAEAMRLAKRACELTSFKDPILVGTLAAACAEAGRFEEAIRQTQTAIDLASTQGLTAIVARNKKLLGLYQSSEPFRETPSGVAP